jgi:hypothetical protein
MSTTVVLFVDNDNMLDEKLQAIKNTEALVFASKKIGLNVNIDKTMYMIMSRFQNARRIHNI